MADRFGFVISQASIEKALHWVVSMSLQARIPHLYHYSEIYGHPGKRCMYDTLAGDYYSPIIAKDVNNSVEKVLGCCKIDGDY